MTSPVPEHKDTKRRGLTHDHILDAAARAFARNGYHGTTMKDVAAELGLTPGALYSYFAGKERLFAAAHERMRERFAQAVNGPMPAGLSLEHQIELVLLRLFELTERYRAELALFIDTQPAEEEPRTRGFHLIRRRLEEWLSTDQRRAALACEPSLAATVLTGIVVALIRVRVIDPSSQPLVPMAAQIRDLFLRGVAASPTASAVTAKER